MAALDLMMENACQQCDLATVREALGFGANANMFMCCSVPINLVISASVDVPDRKRIAIIRQLLEDGADINGCGKSPVYKACQHRRLEILLFLLKHSAIHGKRIVGLYSIFLCVCANGWREGALAIGDYLGEGTNLGKALHCAIRRESPLSRERRDIIQYLIDCGRDAGILGHVFEKKTPLEKAFAVGADADLIAMLRG